MNLEGRDDRSHGRRMMTRKGGGPNPERRRRATGMHHRSVETLPGGHRPGTGHDDGINNVIGGFAG